MHILCVNAFKLLSGFFLGQDLAFFVEDRFGWQPWLLILNWCMTGLGVSYWKF